MKKEQKAKIVGINLNYLMADKDFYRARKKFGSPLFVYSEKMLELNCEEAKNMPDAYGLTVRYAMKANSNKTILDYFDKKGLHIDSSSGLEVERALAYGINPRKIQLSTQDLPNNLSELLKKNIIIDACSINQLKKIGKLSPGREISIRINPGNIEGGSHQNTNTAGEESCFGLWHTQTKQAISIAKEHELKITRLHIHVGSGNKKEVWKKVIKSALKYVNILPEVKTLNIGGGFKVRRDVIELISLKEIGETIKKELIKFHNTTGRKIHLEIEPGTFLVANTCFLLTTIKDKVKTKNYEFLKIDTGMHDLTRPALYQAEHGVMLIKKYENQTLKMKDVFEQIQKKDLTSKYFVSGHCCERDLITINKDNTIKEVELENPEIGDIIIILGCGAYTSSMNLKNYNSYLEPAEILITKTKNREFKLIKRKQTFKQMIQNEV